MQFRPCQCVEQQLEIAMRWDRFQLAPWHRILDALKPIYRFPSWGVPFHRAGAPRIVLTHCICRLSPLFAQALPIAARYVFQELLRHPCDAYRQGFGKMLNVSSVVVPELFLNEPTCRLVLLGPIRRTEGSVR